MIVDIIAFIFVFLYIMTINECLHIFSKVVFGVDIEEACKWEKQNRPQMWVVQLVVYITFLVVVAQNVTYLLRTIL